MTNTLNHREQFWYKIPGAWYGSHKPIFEGGPCASPRCAHRRPIHQKASACHADKESDASRDGFVLAPAVLDFQSSISAPRTRRVRPASCQKYLSGVGVRAHAGGDKNKARQMAQPWPAANTPAARPTAPKECAHLAPVEYDKSRLAAKRATTCPVFETPLWRSARADRMAYTSSWFVLRGSWRACGLYIRWPKVHRAAYFRPREAPVVRTPPFRQIRTCLLLMFVAYHATKCVQYDRGVRWLRGRYCYGSQPYRRVTLAMVRKKFLKGRYLLATNDHIFAMIDGVVHDGRPQALACSIVECYQILEVS
jgi:hypothetical protein